jgi:hypothetical protein
VAPAVLSNTPRPGPQGGTPMANSIIAHPAQESTSREKTASCSGCAQRFPRRELVEVHDEHIALGYGVREGERCCRPCALVHSIM